MEPPSFSATPPAGHGSGGHRYEGAVLLPTAHRSQDTNEARLHTSSNAMSYLSLFSKLLKGLLQVGARRNCILLIVAHVHNKPRRHLCLFTCHSNSKSANQIAFLQQYSLIQTQRNRSIETSLNSRWAQLSIPACGPLIPPKRTLRAAGTARPMRVLPTPDRLRARWTGRRSKSAPTKLGLPHRPGQGKGQPLRRRSGTRARPRSA